MHSWYAGAQTTCFPALNLHWYPVKTKLQAECMRSGNNQPMEISMKSKAIISAIMAVTMSMSGFSFAQGNGNRQDENQNGKGQRADQKARPNNNARRPTPQQNQGVLATSFVRYSSGTLDVTSRPNRLILSNSPLSGGFLIQLLIL